MLFAAIFGIIVGVGMIGQWGMSFATGQIPELKTEPIRIWYHIAAEMATAVMLILSGVLLIMRNDMGNQLFLVACGMLFYTCIVSPGYFAQQGKWGWLVMFVGILVVGVISIFVVL